MKRNILIIILSVALISLGAVVAYKVFNDKILSSTSFSRQGGIDTNYFRLKLPPGWETQEPAPEPFLLKATYVKNGSQDPLARKINYRTNLSIAHETLEGETLATYASLLEAKIKSLQDKTIIRSESQTIFNNNSAYLIDAETKDNNIELKNIIVVIQGERDDAWVISLNTTKLDWDNMAFQFYEVLNSFQLK
ncbi:MAG TPA: hypothetical protein PK547_00530 [Candidatus Paceibacterota bacterium]|nr:hypothetical protein [Candidatus Paceibacterota bacterium]